MEEPLRILYLEDNPTDAELVRARLAAEGIACEIVCVQTGTDYASAIDQGGWALIISDFTLPAYDGMSALALAHTKRPDTPFIFFSGTVGEEAAIDALKKGASDYVLKPRPARLVSAVKRALREAEERTERKKAEQDKLLLEQQLRQAQKMEAIGQLAGGVAHDFNNVLTAIAGNAELLQEGFADGDPKRETVEEIRTAASRAESLTRQLLAFSRQQIMQPKVLKLNRVVAGMEKMLRRLIGEDIDLVCVLPNDVGQVVADPSQIEQVILNLAVNARDAMPTGGKLTIETGNAEFDAIYARAHPPAVPGRFVMIAVSDSGSGMSPEVQARVFEPFFTTKAPGKGTGLGLATVYGIVKQSGGFIWVYSEPGQGTTFKIYLGRAADDQRPETVSTAVAEVRGGDEVILLVEDEAAVRRVALHALQRYGYTVLEAALPSEALTICREHTGKIDLVVTDVVMPGMSGPDLAQQLLALRPALKVLLSSGYPGEAIAHRGELFSGLAFLPKPFTPTGLARKVREVLDAPAPQAHRPPAH